MSALSRLSSTAMIAGAILLALSAGKGSSSTVRGQGFLLKSTAVDLPYDEVFYPDGPGAEVMNANCASCHSASMALTQPKLSRAQWETIVQKMRDVYRAPVPVEDVPQIVDYLDGLRQE